MNLLQALEFVNLAQTKKGTALQTHCYINNKTVVASNGILSAGCEIQEEITAKPNTLQFIEALEKCKDDLVIAKMTDCIGVKSGKFKAFVPCLADNLSITYPDLPTNEITNIIREGFKAIDFLIEEREKKELIKASILLCNNSMYTTNGHLLLEFWHGLKFPNDLVVPVHFINAIAKTKKDLKAYGCCIENNEIKSITFWFTDNSWIKTQTYSEKWPNISKIFNVTPNFYPLYPNFYEALNNIEGFLAKNQAVLFFENTMKTSKEDKQGAEYIVEGLPYGKCFSATYLKAIKPFMNYVDFTSFPDKLYFCDETRVRGCLMGMRF